MEPWRPHHGGDNALARPFPPFPPYDDNALALPFSPFPPHSEGYFTDQAWRAGLFDDGGFRRGGFMPPPMFPMGSIEREIEKDRIREEILREMEERRILEEEVRSELEAERMMMTPMHGFHDRRMRSSYCSEFMNREGYCANQWGGVNRTSSDGAWSGSNLLEIKVDRKSPVPAPVPTPQVLENGNANASQIDEVLPSNEKLVGTKRKAEANTKTSKLAKTANNDWSCDLCQITVTSQQSLNEHFEGKKHRSKVVALKGIGKIVNKTWACEPPTPKPKPAAANVEEGKPNNTRKIINIQVNGKMHQVLQMRNHLWCEVCKFKCNTAMAMASHLEGKKHNGTADVANPGSSEKVIKNVSVGGSVPQTSLEVASEKDPKLDNTEVTADKDDTVVVTEKENASVPVDNVSEEEHTEVPAAKDLSVCD